MTRGCETGEDAAEWICACNRREERAGGLKGARGTARASRRSADFARLSLGLPPPTPLVSLDRLPAPWSAHSTPQLLVSLAVHLARLCDPHSRLWPLRGPRTVGKASAPLASRNLCGRDLDAGVPLWLVCASSVRSPTRRGTGRPRPPNPLAPLTRPPSQRRSLGCSTFIYQLILPPESNSLHVWRTKSGSLTLSEASTRDVDVERDEGRSPRPRGLALSQADLPLPQSTPLTLLPASQILQLVRRSCFRLDLPVLDPSCVSPLGPLPPRPHTSISLFVLSRRTFC